MRYISMSLVYYHSLLFYLYDALYINVVRLLSSKIPFIQFILQATCSGPARSALAGALQKEVVKISLLCYVIATTREAADLTRS